MSSYSEKEAKCLFAFSQLGNTHHLWTPENHEIIFTSSDDFRTGMSIFGIASRLTPQVKILTFELMSNHVHITASGEAENLLAMFDLFRKMLARWLKGCDRPQSLDNFKASIRQITTLEDLRNVIVYDNRNGFVVSDSHTPFSYPWGANRYYFSPDSCRLAMAEAKVMGLRERRLVSHSRAADAIDDLQSFEGCALPLSFCDVALGECMFRDATHYFNRLSKSVESNAIIAKEIGESMWHTDDEMYSIAVKICRERFEASSPRLLNPAAKLELARILHYEFSANLKQVQRMLRIDKSLLDAMGLGGNYATK